MRWPTLRRAAWCPFRKGAAKGAALQTKRPITAVLGSRLQYGFFEVLVRCRMLFAARVVLAFVVLYYAMLPHVRQRCAAYIGRRFPRAGADQPRFFVPG